jgi:PAS domain S-box-containing protein
MKSTSPDKPQLWDRPRAAWLGYAGAALAVAAATLVRLALDPVLGANYPFVTYLGAVAVIAWFGRTPAAVFTLVVGGLLTFYLFAPKDVSLWLGTGLYFLVAAVIVAMSHAMRQARSRAEGLLAEAVVRQKDLQQSIMAEAEQREGLRTTREQMAATLESVTDGFIRYDRDWQIVYVNAEAERINRFRRGEVLGRNLWELFPATVGTTLETEFRRAVTDQVTVDFENFYEPWGRWYALKGYPAPDGGLTTFIRDITEQKAQREALAESEARYRAIGESIDFGVWVCDASGRNTYASESFLRMVGLTQQQCSGSGWADVLHPDDATETIAAWKECVRTQGTWDRVHRFKGVDGSWYSVLARGVPLRNAAGVGLGWAGINLDITRLVQTEQEIVRLAAESARRQRLYETVLKNTPDFVYVFSLDHKVLYANDALIKMWGRGHDGAIGKTFLEIGYEPWHAQMHDREIDQVRATRQPIRGEVPFSGTNGRRQYDYIFVPVIGADGEVEAVAGTTRDVTERKQTEDQLRRNHDTFFALIQNNPFGVYAVDADFRLRQVSLGARKVFETVRPLLGRDFAEVLRTLWPEPFASEAIGRFRHTLDTGEPYAAPSTVERRADSGAVEAYDWRIERIGLPDGRYGVVCYFYDLSERQQWEAILLDNKERLRLATDAAQLGIWTWQPERDVVVWENERPYEIFALARTEPPVTAARFKADFLHPEDSGVFELAFERAGRMKEPLLCECRIRRTDGETRWVQFTGRAVEGDDNQRLIGTVQDITERKKVEEAIRASEARHRYTVTLADTIRPLSDPLTVQAEASRVLGERIRAHRVAYFELRDGHFVIERDYADGVPPVAGRYPVAAFGPDLLAAYQAGRTATEADVDAVVALTAQERQAFAAIQTRAYVGVPLVKDGTLVAGLAVHAARPRAWTATEVALIEDTAERTWSAVERVRAEAALRTSEERFRTLFSTMDEGFCVIEVEFDRAGRATDYRIELMNPAFEKHTGMQGLVGRSVRQALPALEEFWFETYGRVATTGEPARVVHKVEAMEGRWFEVSALRLGGDGSHKVAVLFNDMTERKLADAIRERLVVQLLDQDRRKDVFLATLAHELRNPLAPIRYGLQLIRMAGAQGTVEQARSMMERQLVQMTRLVDDLLDVSRVTTGKLELRRERLELRAVIAAALETSRPLIEQEGHDLVVVVPDAPIFVDGDPIRMAQVVSNLLNNSAKYTRRGGHIRVSVSLDEAVAVLTVADDGIGIPRAMLEAVFGMFTQVDRTLEKTTGGLGIGLSLVKGLVEMHGGTIEARSEGEGRGSEFAIRLPVAAFVVSESEPSDAQANRVEPSGSRRILIVDDNVDSADSLGQFLAMMGNEVRTAYDGAAGVEAARAFQPCVVLCDIGMPKVNGYDTARSIRAEAWAKNTVLVALTGWSQEDDLQMSADAGFDHHLVKPVEAAALMKLLAGLRPLTA